MYRVISFILPLLTLSILWSQNQWEMINQPDLGTVSIILAEGNELLAATNQAQVYTSIDQAESWQLLADTMNTLPYAADLLFKKGDAVFFTQNIGSGPYNFRCLVGFAGWGPWQELPHQSSALIRMVANNSIIFTLLNGISTSSYLGETWTAIPEPPITGYIQLLLATDDYLYVNHGCQVFRTGDLGETWEDITGILDEEGFEDPYSCSAVMAMASHGDQLIISMYWGGSLGKLFVSSDDGATWSVLDDFPVDHHVTAMVSKNNVFYAGTASSVSGVYYTTDLVSWTDFSSGLESYDRSVSQLAATDEYLFKTGGTVSAYQISLPELAVDEHSFLPNEFILHQNYPNPFNPSTTLRYDLPENSFVSITIYNMLGREVRTLVNSTQNAGYKSVIWDASSNNGKTVSAGVYLYHIQAGEFVQTKKMVLLK